MNAPGGVPMVGVSYLLADPHYRYGTGPLLIRVIRVIGPVEFGEAGRVEVWWEVEAFAKPPSYTGTGPQRHLYIRADCLRTARHGSRPPDQGPDQGSARGGGQA